MIVGVSVRGTIELCERTSPAIREAAAWFAHSRGSCDPPINPALRTSKMSRGYRSTARGVAGLEW